MTFSERDLLRVVLREDLYAFIESTFPIVSGEALFLDNWHIEAIAYQLQRVLRGEITRLIITVPPRSLKSICASVCLPAFALGRDPTRRIVCVSYSDALAKKHANDCRALMHSGLYRWIFPNTRISLSKDTETEFVTTAKGYRLSTSVGGTLTGRGGNLIIIDDPLKPQEAHSESAREALKQWYTSTLLSRLDNKATGAIIIVMQRLHTDDLVGYLLEQGGFEHLNFPAIAEESMRIPLDDGSFFLRQKGDLLHPEREPQQVLDELKRAMGSLDFAAQYQQAPIQADGNYIKWSWFKFYDQLPVPRFGDRVILSWDTAQTPGELADYSVCMVFLIRGETFYLLDVLRERLEYPDLRRRVIGLYTDWKKRFYNTTLLIERHGSGLSLLQDLKEQNIHGIGFKPEGDKIMRMTAQSAKIESGAVHLPYNATWLGELRKEIAQFPNGKHDDQIDALSQALSYASRPRHTGPLMGYYQVVR